MVVGLGPGPACWIAPEASAALEAATDIVGYQPYIDRIPERTGQRRHGSDNRVEIDRAQHALTMAAEGRQVAVVSGGDPGVFAMAAAVFEAIEAGDPAWRSLDVTVVPGISAMQAAAEGDFVIALYNPASKARPERIHDAFALLRDAKSATTPVAFARSVGRDDEQIALTTLGEADPAVADMSTLVMIGSSETRFIDRPGKAPWLLTPRSYGVGR